MIDIIYVVYTTYIVGLMALIYASITDFKYREIPNHITITLFVIGLIINLILIGINIDYVRYLFYVLLIFSIFYIIWRLGIISGGDAKLYIAIYALIPHITQSIYNYPLFLQNQYFILGLFIYSLLLVFPYVAFVGLYKLIGKKQAFQIIKDEFLDKGISIFESAFLIISIYLVLSWLGLSNMLIIPISFFSGFLPHKIRIFFTAVFLPIALYTNFYYNVQQIIIFVMIAYVVWIIIKLFVLTKSGLFNTNIKVSAIKEGDLLAYPLVYDKTYYFYKSELLCAIKTFNPKIIIDAYNKRKDIYKKVIINNELAMGLTKADASLLKKVLNKDAVVELKLTTPIAPAILIAYVVLILFGDFIWLIYP